MYNQLLSASAAKLRPSKRKVFISYHHKDQAWINQFRALFSGTYDIFIDCSLDQAIDSDNLHYVNRAIREDYITGTSITIVICGTDTWRRRCVDWEICSTLNKDHALLAIPLPHNREIRDGQEVRVLPNRLHKNIQSGYAYWTDWVLDATIINNAIEVAIDLSVKNKKHKHNLDLKMSKNL